MFESDSYKKIFNERADRYHHAMQAYPSARNAEFEIALSLADIEPGHTLLDMPAGGGYLAKFISDELKLIHLEFSKVFANLSEPISPHSMLLVEGNGLPFSGGSIDRLVSIAGMHHVEDKTSVFREVFRVLKPGGCAVIADAQVSSIVAKFLDECVDAMNPSGHQGSYFSDTTLQILKSIGFDVCSQAIDYTWNFSSEMAMVDFCKHMFDMRLGSDNDILEGLRCFLGFRSCSNLVELNWQLNFIRLKKPILF